MRPLPALLAALVLALQPLALAEDLGPEDCDADETWDAAASECVRVEGPQETAADCHEDEVYDAEAGECVDAPEAEDGSSEDAPDATVEDSSGPSGEDTRSEDDVNATEDQDDEDSSGPSGDAEDEADDDAETDADGEDGDDEEDDEECEERKTRSEREDRLDNGTRYRERVRTTFVDCPGTANDRTETEREVEWDEDHEEDEAEIEIEEDDDLRATVQVPATSGTVRAADVTMRANASVLTLADDVGATALEVAFLEVLEFEDIDGNGGYDLDDVVVHAWRVAGLPANATTEDGVLTVTYALPPGGNLSFVYRALDGRAKFDVVIDGFAYATSGSQLALRAAFEASDAEYEQEDGRGVLATKVGDRRGTFDWVATVDADGQELPVVATVYVGDGAAAGTAQVYLAYPRAHRVVHDPSLGFETVSAAVEAVQAALFSPTAYAVAAVAGVAFVAVGWAVRRRR